MLSELKELLQQWNEDGDQIAVRGDFNEDVRRGTIFKFFQELDMKEIILQQHGNNTSNTYQRGHAPIDGIFAMATLQAVNSGYSPMHWGCSTNHRLLWVDLSSVQVFGDVVGQLWHPHNRQLILQDQRIVNKFLHLRVMHAIHYDLRMDVTNLFNSIEGNKLTREQEDEYE
jgi:hypothetical protein